MAWLFDIIGPYELPAQSLSLMHSPNAVREEDALHQANGLIPSRARTKEGTLASKWNDEPASWKRDGWDF